MITNSNLIFAVVAAGFLLIVLMMWWKRRGNRKERLIECQDDIKWWREL